MILPQLFGPFYSMISYVSRLSLCIILLEIVLSPRHFHITLLFFCFYYGKSVNFLIKTFYWLETPKFKYQHHMCIKFSRILIVLRIKTYLSKITKGRLFCYFLHNLVIQMKRNKHPPLRHGKYFRICTRHQ